MIGGDHFSVVETTGFTIESLQDYSNIYGNVPIEYQYHLCVVALNLNFQSNRV